MMTDGVMVIMAAVMKWKAWWVVAGNVEIRFTSVEYDAMMIGGKGGKSG